MKGVYIFLAEGFEDMEALATNDVLVRGGVEVNPVSVTGEPFVVSSHGITVGTDMCLEDLDSDHGGTDASDVMIFPGGMPGTKNLAACAPLMRLMQDHYDAGGAVAAICAAPGLVLSRLGDRLKGAEFTCFEGFQDYTTECGARFNPVPAVISGRIITGRSAGWASEFGLKILEFLTGEENARKVAYSLYLQEN